MTTAGLREAKKAATRQALAVAVLRLSARDGFHNVSVEAVAAEVGVSPRTFHNYFPGKEEALRFYLTEVVDRVFTTLESRPADESFWDSTAAAFIEVISNGAEDPRELVHLMTVVDSEPSLAMTKPSDGELDPIEERFKALCERRSVGRQGARHSRLVLGCAAICVRVALEEQAASDTWSRTEVRDALQDTFNQVRNGFGAVPVS